MNLKSLVVIVSIMLLPVVGGAQGKISLTNPVTCSFQVGQYMDLKETKTYSEKGVLEWKDPAHVERK